MYKKDTGNGCYKLAEIKEGTIIQRYYNKFNKLYHTDEHTPFIGECEYLLLSQGYVKLKKEVK